MHRTQLFIPEEMHNQIKKEANEQRISLSEYVRQVLEEKLTKSNRLFTEKGLQTLLSMTEEEA